ncbi:MAG: hypothetical protein EB116_17270 [Betaproteobacteria bacterium]|nr:hypothetical protein [Betaproteobacteria bacterium]
MTDRAGNTAYTPETGSFTLDTVAQTAAMGLVLTADTGSSSTDRMTQDGNFTLTVPTAEPNLERIDYEAKQLLTAGAVWYTLGGLTTAQGFVAGSVTTLTGTPDGAWVFRALVTDRAGNTAYTPETGSFTLDTVAPSTGQINFALNANWVTNDTILISSLSDAQFALDVVGEEIGSQISYEVDLPGNQSITNFVPVGSGFTFGGGSFTFGSDASVTLGATGVWVFRAIVTDVAGNSGYAGGFASLGVFLSTQEAVGYGDNFAPVYMKRPGVAGSIDGDSLPPTRDSQFSFTEVDSDSSLEMSSLADSKATALGQALVSYLDGDTSRQAVGQAGEVDAFTRPTPSMAILAEALSTYQMARPTTLAPLQSVSADLVRKIDEESESYRKSVLAPPSGST